MSLTNECTLTEEELKDHGFTHIATGLTGELEGRKIPVKYLEESDTYLTWNQTEVVEGEYFKMELIEYGQESSTE